MDDHDTAPSSGHKGRPNGAPGGDRHHRRSIRLKGYDYTHAGGYFVTICTQDRACLFGEVVDDAMRLNAAGEMVAHEWRAISGRFPHVVVDDFVVMPNHIHGLLMFGTTAPRRDPDGSADPHDAPGGRPGISLSEVVGAFKSRTTVAYGRGVRLSGWSPFGGRLWQRNFYEHIVRDEDSLDHIRQYIRANPSQWPSDRENPVATIEPPTSDTGDDT